MKHYVHGFEGELMQGSRADGTEDKQLLKIQPPSVLSMCCHALEFMRLRTELILCLSECAIL